MLLRINGLGIGTCCPALAEALSRAADGTDDGCRVGGEGGALHRDSLFFAVMMSTLMRPLFSLFFSLSSSPTCTHDERACLAVARRQNPRGHVGFAMMMMMMIH